MVDLTALRFIHRLIAERPPSRNARSSVAKWFCEHHGIGTLIPPQIFYQPHHFTLAEQFLKANNLPQSLEGVVSRADMAAHGGISEKAASLRPHANSVALQLWGVSQEGSTPPGMYLVSTIEDALSITCDRIMVVENFETFRQLHQYRWLDSGGYRVLVLYRGDNLYPLTDSASLVRQRSEPVWAFVDFDPAGLSIAQTVGAGRLERLVLPSKEWLRESADTARGRELFATQALSPSPQMHPQVLAAFELLQSLQGGVTQERMRDAV